MAQDRARGTIFEGMVERLRLHSPALDAKPGEWLSTGHPFGWSGWNREDIGGLRAIATVRVTRKHRGDVPVSVDVTTGIGLGDCGYNFEEGHSYLIVANGNPGKLWTSICDDTAPLEQQTAILRYLRGERPHKEELAVFRSERDWNLVQRGREHAIPHGKVCGRLVGLGNREALGLHFWRVGGVSSAWKYVELDGDGRFCSALAPGRYIIALLAAQNPNDGSDGPYGPESITYYPGVKERVSALPVVVNGGETTNIEFATAAQQTTHSVAVVVTMSRPADLRAAKPKLMLLPLDDKPFMEASYGKVINPGRLERLAHVDIEFFPKVLPGRYMVFIETEDHRWKTKKAEIIVTDHMKITTVPIRFEEAN